MVLALAIGGAGVALWPQGAGTPGEGDPGRLGRANGLGPTLSGAGPRAAGPEDTARSGGVRLRGRVVRGGLPAAARVEAHLQVPGVRGARGRVGRAAEWIPGAGIAPRVFRATAGPDGAFALERLPLGGYLVLARTPGGAAGGVWAEASAHGETKEVLVEVLGGDLSLDGRVEQADGSPWRGQVDVGLGDPRTSSLEAPELRGHPTDASGRFHVEGLAPGPAWVTAWQEGRARYESAELHLPYAGDYVLRLPPEPPELGVRVLDAGTALPIRGARVAVSVERLGALRTWMRVAYTDAQGRCSAPGDPAQHPLQVSAAGYAGVTLASGFPGLDGALEVRLAPLPDVRGRVVEGEAGTPVAGAGLVLFQGLRTWDLLHAATSREDGTFEVLAVQPGSDRSEPLLLAVFGGGWISPELLGDPEEREARPVSGAAVAGLRLTAGPGAVDPVERVAVRAGSVEGRVLDAAGRPVAGATVITAAAAGAVTALPVATDGAGRFTLDTLVPGRRTRLRVEAPAQPPVHAFVTAAAGARAHLEIRLPEPAWLSVRTVDAATGAPVPRLQVWAEFQDAGASEAVSHYVYAWGDAQGRARLGPVRPGPCEVSVSADGRETLAVSAVAQVGTEAEVLLRVRSLLAIEGRVRFADGSPGCDLDLAVSQDNPDYDPGWSETDDEGRFRITDLPAGEYLLAVGLRDREGRPLLTRTVEAGARGLELVLPEGAGRGPLLRVLDEQAQPVAGFLLRQTSDGCTSSQRGRSGGVRLRAFVGEAWALVSDALGADGAPLDLTPTLVGPLRPGGALHEVRMRPASRITGRVEDPEGRAVAGASVVATALAPLRLPDPSLPDLDTPRTQVVCDAAGRFELRGLSPGPHELRVLPAEGPARGPAVVAEAGASDVRLRLAAPRPVDVLVVDTEGRPVAGARVRLGEGEDVTRAVTDAGGRARLPDVVPEVPYVLRVTPPSTQASRLGDTTDSAWTSARTRLVLELKRRLAGTVIDADGRPAPEAWVLAARGGSVVGNTLSGRDGTFVLADLPSGALEVTARGAGAQDGTCASASLGPDAMQVRLVLLPGATLEVRLREAPAWAAGRTAYLTRNDQRGANLSGVVEPGGSVRFVGLVPSALYALELSEEGVTDERHVAWLESVRGDAARVEVAVTPWQRWTGFVRGLPPGERAFVSIDGYDHQRDVPTRQDGGFVLDEAPAGPVTVVARCRSASGLLEGRARVTSGDVAEVVLQPVSER